MFFYVFIDPDTISDASAQQSDLGRLIDLLRSMDRGCLIAETDLWRVEREIKEKVKAIGFQHERKMVGDLLINLWSKGPHVLMSGDDEECQLIDFAVANAARDSLDLILSPKVLDAVPGHEWEASSLPDLHATRFSRTRHNIGAGLSFTAGDITSGELFSKCFRKLIYHAEKIVIIDYALGAYYGNDHPSNLRRWVLWIDQNLNDPANATLVIRTLVGDGLRSLRNQVDDLRNEVELTLVLETVPTRDLLPHRRFLVADHRCLDIDRGIDICDSAGQCRGVDIIYANRPR
jgi:hypothetical protein